MRKFLKPLAQYRGAFGTTVLLRAFGIKKLILALAKQKWKCLGASAEPSNIVSGAIRLENWQI
jgi:hypothetical protein